MRCGIHRSWCSRDRAALCIARLTVSVCRMRLRRTVSLSFSKSNSREADWNTLFGSGFHGSPGHFRPVEFSVRNARKSAQTEKKQEDNRDICAPLFVDIQFLPAVL